MIEWKRLYKKPAGSLPGGVVTQWGVGAITVGLLIFLTYWILTGKGVPEQPAEVTQATTTPPRNYTDQMTARVDEETMRADTKRAAADRALRARQQQQANTAGVAAGQVTAHEAALLAGPSPDTGQPYTEEEWELRERLRLEAVERRSRSLRSSPIAQTYRKLDGGGGSSVAERIVDDPIATMKAEGAEALQQALDTMGTVTSGLEDQIAAEAQADQEFIAALRGTPAAPEAAPLIPATALLSSRRPIHGRALGRQWFMNFGRTVFSQLINFLPDREFRRCVSRYDGDCRLRSFSCWDQFLSMAFAQLTYRESLRDIEACLRSLGAKLYHMGFRGNIARSTLADANESRDWRIYADFAQVLIRIARPLYARDPIGVDLDQSLYALDSTTIDLCLKLFPWAQFRQRKAVVKMHTLLDLRGNIPTFIRITAGKTHDVNILDEFLPEPGAFYVMDRAYVDFQRLFVFTLCSSFFVVRTKKNILLQRRYSHPVDPSTGVRSDQTVILTTFESAQAYPDPLRRVSYFDAATNKRLKFLTNNFALPALTIAEIYRSRWQVELFFRWIKQHLRIKNFYGASENAVKTQIWIAVSVYVLVAIVRKRLGLEASLYQILQILSVTLFEKTPILQALQPSDSHDNLLDDPNQLILFDF